MKPNAYLVRGKSIRSTLIPICRQATLVMLWTLTATASLADVVDDSFLPYAKRLPQTAEMERVGGISKRNVEQFQEVIDPEILDAVKKGWIELAVRPTTSFNIESSYVEATRKYIGSTKLGSKDGELANYVGGRPFPEEPQLSDPRAGEKIAWNFRYRQGASQEG